jgi:hypothetical protein
MVQLYHPELVCLFVCLGVNKASQEGALQRHPGIELSFNIPKYGGYDLGCHRRFSFYLRRNLHPFSRARITEGVAFVVKQDLIEQKQKQWAALHGRAISINAWYGQFIRHNTDNLAPFF